MQIIFMRLNVWRCSICALPSSRLSPVFALGVLLQQMLISYGFLLVVASADGKMPSSRDLAQRPLHPADKLYSTAPYNLYCFQADMLDTPKAPQAYSHQDGLRRDQSASHRQRSFRNRRRLSRDNNIEV